VRVGLVSFDVLIVAVKIFSPAVISAFPWSGSRIGTFLMLGHVPWFVSGFSSSRSLALMLVPQFVSSSSSSSCSADFLSASALTRAFSLVERLDRFLVRFALVRRSEEIFVFGCRLLMCKLL
jgi:hypothetical protein